MSKEFFENVCPACPIQSRPIYNFNKQSADERVGMEVTVCSAADLTDYNRAWKAAFQETEGELS